MTSEALIIFVKCPCNICVKRHFDFCPKKLSKYPNFYDICLENARILHDNCPKNIFPIFFFFGGGEGLHVPTCPPSLTLMAKKV